jgi:signal transduction histidine kinase
MSKKTLSRSAVAAYLSICAALLALLGLTTWGSLRDMEFLRATLLHAEIDRLRSHAERTVERIERDLQQHGTYELNGLDREPWLRRYVREVVPAEKRRMYAAIVGPDGAILLHSNAAQEGRRLPRHWYTRTLDEGDDDVVETRSPALTLNEPAYDVRIPVVVDQRELGEYHAGIAVDWFDGWTSEKQSSFLWRRFLLVGGVLLILLTATTSLYFIASNSIALRRAIDSASVERASEVGKLAAGLAHEIRNPLHAIQLNLHSFRRAQQHSDELPPDEMTKMLDESTREIERIERLMRQLVGFATPDASRNGGVDLPSEIGNVVDFIQQEMLEQNVEIATNLPGVPLRAQMDRGRLRQIMLNLLQNAEQAMQGGGRITISVARRRRRLEVVVADDGPGISEEDRKRIFEPFYSTKQDGTGLGLALVKRFVDEVDGRIRCEANEQGGATFRIALRESRATKNE